MTTLSLPQLDGRDLITNSRLSALKSCPRKHYFGYELGLRPDTSAKPLRMGSAYHVGLEAWGEGEEPAECIALATAQYESLPSWCKTEEQVHEWMVERETVARLLEGYFWRWAVVDDDNSNDPVGVIDVIATELAFEVPIVNPETGKPTPSFKRAGKIDGIVKLVGGRVAVREFKTTSDDISPESDYWKRLRIDEQISGYYVAAKALGHDVQTVLYDVTRKPDISPRQIPLVDAEGFKIVLNAAGERVYTKDGKKPRESGDAAQGFTLQTRVETAAEFGERLAADIKTRPNHYYARQEIPRLASDLEDYEYELWQQQQQLRDSQRLGRWFRNTNSCIGFGKCPYFGICTDGIDVHATTPNGFIRVQNIHQELAQ